MKIRFVILASLAIAGVLAVSVVGRALGDTASRTDTNPPTITAAGATTPQQIYAANAPAVVVITDTQTQKVPPTLFTPSLTERVSALGSGFVIDTNGNIVTNYHVVQHATGIRVGFSNGASYPATIVGTDPSTDLAVVRVQAPASSLQPASFGSSAAALPGDTVYAIGNPFGLERTMTAGIVSATGRDIKAPNGITIPNAIQTDAAINHGNSGGPLLDASGHVIGISDQIVGGNGNVGIGFAVPSDTAHSVVDQLIATGHVQHAWLGLQVETIPQGVAGAVHGMPSQGAAVARVVHGGPAAKAGLRAGNRRVSVNGVSALLGGDAIVAVDGQPIVGAQQLGRAVAARQPGDRVTLQVVRGGRSRTVGVTLGDTPA
jgi:S1-C subfamily serine protease